MYLLKKEIYFLVRADEVSMNFRNICFMFLLYATICIVRGDNIVEQLLQRVSKLENENAKMAKIENELTISIKL